MSNKVTCDVCGGTFKDESGLEQHKAAKHSELRNKSSGEGTLTINKKYVVYAVIILAVLIGAYFFYSKPTPSGNYDDFAKCIANSGAKFYGAFWCPHCVDQKNLFGSSTKYLPYVECSTSDGKGQTAACQAAGIQGYPTWEFSDGSRASGSLSFEQLSQKTGCKLTK